MLLSVFSPNVSTEQEMFAWIEVFLDTPEKRAGFIDAFREFLLDPEMSIQEKAGRMLEYDTTEEDALDLFRDRWKAVAIDQPFPLDK